MSNGDCGVAITNISLYCCLWLQWSFVVTIARHLARLLWALLTSIRSIITYFTIFWSYSQFVSRSCYDQAVHHTNWPLARWQYFMQMLNFNLYGKKWNFLLLLLLLVFRFSFFFFLLFRYADTTHNYHALRVVNCCSVVLFLHLPFLRLLFSLPSPVQPLCESSWHLAAEYIGIIIYSNGIIFDNFACQ